MAGGIDCKASATYVYIADLPGRRRRRVVVGNGSLIAALCAGNKCGCRPESMDRAPEKSLCVGGWSGIRVPRGGLAERRPACRAATIITTSNSPADNACVVDACVFARHPTRMALPALHSRFGTSGSPYCTHVADYKDVFRRTRDAASRRRQLARHMPSACAGTSVILLRWTPEKKHAVQRLLTRTAI